MNLLALSSALLISGANVLNTPIKQHSNNKMIDVVEKYQSNEVNDWSDLVVGNIYEFNFDDYTIYDFVDPQSGQGLILQPLLPFNYIYDETDESVLTTGTYNNVSELVSIVYFMDNSTYLVFNFDNDVYEGNYVSLAQADLVGKNIYVLKGFFGTNDPSVDFKRFYSEYIKYTDYNVYEKSTTHRGNLYTTIYDFFYGIFDASDTNELSMEIMGQNMSLTSWLAHTVTIILLLLGVVWLIFVIRWIFRVFSGLIHV